MFKKLLGILLVICCLTVYAGAETQTDNLIGTINGDTYENRILGIGCSLPDWKYASKEEIQAIWQQTLSAIPDNVSDLVESSGNVTLMFANDASGAQNVNIQIQKQNAAVLTMIDSYGMNGYMAAIQNELASTYESMGMENVQLTTDEIQISGKPFSCFRLSYTYQGFPVYTLQVIYLQEEYSVYLTAVSYVNDTTEDIISNFYVIE